MDKGWIGVDLDGTLAIYNGWEGVEHIGEPIPLMVNRVKGWLSAGITVKIFTARVDGGEAAIEMGNEAGKQYRDVDRVKSFIRAWCKEHIGVELEITCRKDYGMIELWDDRCRQVQANTGKDVSDQLTRALEAVERLRAALILARPHLPSIDALPVRTRIEVGEAAKAIDEALAATEPKPVDPEAPPC